MHFKNPQLNYSHRRVMNNIYLLSYEYLITFIFRISYHIFNTLFFFQFLNLNFSLSLIF